MQQLFACPCSQQFAVPPSASARQVRCPRCSRVLLVPATQRPAARVASPGPPPLAKPASRRGLWLALMLIVLLATAVGGFFIHKALNRPDSPTEVRREEKPPAGEPAPKPPVVEEEPATPALPNKPPPDVPRRPPETGSAVGAVARLNAARQAAGLASAVLDDKARGQTLDLRQASAAAIEELLADPSSRLCLLDPDLARVGIGDKLVLGIDARQPAQTAILYPAAGQKDVPPAFPGNEVPDPIPFSKDKIAGFPITATFPDRARLRKAEGKLLDADGKEVAAWFSSPEKPANPQYRGYQGTSLCLIAQNALQYGTGYTVEMSAELDGKPWSQRWNFTTLTRQKEIEGMTPRIMAEVNAARKNAGLQPLALDDDLTRACQAHALYIARNAGRPDLNLNDEDPRLPGATDEGRRIARAAHVSAAPFDPGWLVDGWLASFHYRFPLLDREARKIGIGGARGPRDWYGVIVLADPGPPPAEPLAYPGDGQAGVMLDYESGEKPDPISESKDRRAGFPISLMFPPNAKVREVKAELRLGKEDVPFWISTPERPVAEDMQHNTVCLIARRPFKPDSRYEVKVTAKVVGKPFEKAWSFRTRGIEADQGEAAAQAAARVNHQRRLSGLPPVTVDAELSRGCRLHARYLLANLDHPSTQGLGMHDEDPKLPGFTPEGKQAGADSVIASGMPPLPSIDDWLATFYHRIPLLDPDLGRIGFGYVRGGPVGWFVVLNAVGGKGRDSSVVYPGDGQKDVPVKSKAGGYPLTVTFFGGKTMRPAEAVLRGADGKEVTVRLSPLESALVITPSEPLKPGTAYTMTLKGQLDRKAWSRTWTFSTAGE